MLFKELAERITWVATAKRRKQIAIKRAGRRDNLGGTCEGKKINCHLKSWQEGQIRWHLQREENKLLFTEREGGTTQVAPAMERKQIVI